MHTSRLIKYNKLIKSKYNRYDLSGEYGIGWTSNTDHIFYFDLEDYDKIKNVCWREHTKQDGYIILEGRLKRQNKTVTMANIICGYWYDHISRNTFDNRKCNLRKCTVQENTINHPIRKDNTSNKTGVYYNKKNNKWVAYININKKQTYLGNFNNYNDAVNCRREAEKKYYKEFAP